MWYAGPGWGWAMFIGMMVFWVVVVVLIVWAVRMWAPGQQQNQGQAQSPPQGFAQRPAGPLESPLDIAKRRYAAGEITREEFEQLRRDLA